MLEEVKLWRKERRASLLAQREAIPRDARRALNERITHCLVEGFPRLKDLTIGFYWPHRGEFDPRLAVLHFRKAGAEAALPVVLRKAAPLEFRRWWPGAPVTEGAFGLPCPETEAVRPQALLIPPVGFDSRGYRLGYGGGYFDRTLAGWEPQPLKIGVAFESSRIATIRPQSHDVPMDFIVTEAGIHRVAADGLELVA